ncbi:hypothetical protein TNCV_2553701 [Trichonephila clavipes]|nr:hypothetical protein TNCV_2553701 [Trichonephila clavipes]
MVIRSEGAVEYVMVGVSRRPTQAIWRGKEIEPVQVIVMSFDPVKIVVASELKQFEFNGIEIAGFIYNYPVSEVRVNEFLKVKRNTVVMKNMEESRPINVVKSRFDINKRRSSMFIHPGILHHHITTSSIPWTVIFVLNPSPMKQTCVKRVSSLRPITPSFTASGLNYWRHVGRRYLFGMISLEMLLFQRN